MNTQPILFVKFFMTQSGNEPVLELLRKMEADLWEARSKLHHGNISRVFFTIFGNQMILLHGFIKKSQKTPNKEIELACHRKNDGLKEYR